MTKLKYRFILWLATLLGCRYLIYFDEYDNVVPRKIKPYKGKILDVLLPFSDPLSKIPVHYKRIFSYQDKLKEMGLVRPNDKPFTHYEAPKKDDK